MKFSAVVTGGFAAVLAGLAPCSAQSQIMDGEPETTIPTGARKQVEINRTETPPVIDGVLDDPVWRTAARISDMHQYQPVDQGRPTERSEFFIAYDDRYFYLAARLYDSEPSEIIARQLIQGQGMPFDDAFQFILDTFDNSRTGYFFQANANGIRREGVFEGPNNLNTDWQGIWEVQARIDDQGWTAEVAIPFNTLNFDPEIDQWGFTIGRTIARKREENAWSSFNRQLNPTTTGIMTGLSGLQQGLGLDIIPSITVARSDDHVLGMDEDRVDPSLNVFYKFTPNLTGALTLNTDFSATEVDNRQVNLSRFSLFFPEKRDFFLQDVDIFSFGGLGGGGFGSNQNGIPFYSRRVGLSASGEPVDIGVGAKLTGRVGRFNVGALAVEQDAFGAVDSQQMMVVRAAANVLGESSVGFIATDGNPTSNLDNSLVGTDFRYQNTRFTDSHNFTSNMWFQKSETEGIESGNEKAFGATFDVSTQGTGASAFGSYDYLGEDFNPGLGFANRVGIDRFNIGGNYRYFLSSHPIVRNVFSFMNYEYTRVLETKELQSENWFWNGAVNTHTGDQMRFGFWRNREGLQQDFAIRPGIVIPQGKYSFSGVEFRVEMANQRVFSPSFRYNEGSYFDGDRTRIEGGFNWRPNRHVRVGVDYSYQDIDLPQGSFDVRLISIDASYAIDANWSWVNLVQYDNFTDAVGINSRLRWNPQAGEDLFLVLNYNFESEGVFSGMNSRDSEIVLKYSRTLRF